MRPHTAALLALAVALPATASASDLTWKWDQGQHRRYFMQTGIKFQSNFPMGAAIKYGFSAQDLLVTSIVDCEATELRKKKTTLLCTIERVELLAGAGNAASTEEIQAVLDEWRTKLTGATYTTTMTPDGRLGPGELDGVSWPSENRRTNRILNGMEQVVDRLFASLDVGLPKVGSAWEDGWVAKNHQSMMIPTSSGGNGMNKVQFTIDGTEGSFVDALTRGEGTIMEGVDANTPRAFSFEMDGIVRFDTERGELAAHAYRSTGTLTANSVALPGRRPEGASANSSPITDVASAGGVKEPTGDVSKASAGGGGLDRSLTRGGAYDPDAYLETARVYVLGEGEVPELGATGPMLYITGDAADPASGDAPAEDAAPAGDAAPAEPAQE
ncbi:MAG: hypothetical protein EP330_30100 [Deltaproteobacteria bacterium]|nr:MAG: hypothetical protein EP330_30100 [Deltaproteobacteria bacterium]